jgi:hypothetical protein
VVATFELRLLLLIKDIVSDVLPSFSVTTDEILGVIFDWFGIETIGFGAIFLNELIIIFDATLDGDFESDVRSLV